MVLWCQFIRDSNNQGFWIAMFDMFDCPRVPQSISLCQIWDPGYHCNSQVFADPHFGKDTSILVHNISQYNYSLYIYCVYIYILLLLIIIIIIYIQYNIVQCKFFEASNISALPPRSSRLMSGFWEVPGINGWLGLKFPWYSNGIPMDYPAW